MTWKTLIGSAAAYVIILFRHGYTFGSGDQSEMLPYAKFLKNNTLYANDFYIQNIAAHVPNERFVFLSRTLRKSLLHCTRWRQFCSSSACIALRVSLLLPK